LLDKCSNPSCRESFRYLQQGRLFRLECDPDSDSRYSPKRPEYFWLCGNCAGEMTLRLDETTRITTLRVTNAIEPTHKSMDFVPLDRKRGLVLSCLHFLGRAPQQNWTPVVRGKLVYAS
jgi:hypothetical protein